MREPLEGRTVPVRRGAAARQALPDQLRGLALLGIAVVNMPFLAISTGGYTPASVEGLPDRAVAFAVVALAQGKFYLLFSFLFGYSLVLAMRGGRGLRPYRRRLVGLAVLGAGHATLFFVGDILLTYAVLGLVLLAFAGRSDRTTVRAAAAAAGTGLVLLLLVALTPQDDAGAGIVGDAGAVDAGLLGSFADGAAARLRAWPSALALQAVLNASLALAMFLLGLVAGRRGLLAEPERHHTLWRRLLLLGVLVGLPGGLTSAWLTFGPGGDGQSDPVATAIGFATAPALTGAYIALAARATRSRVLTFFSPAGRMSLTGYLGESILMAAVFCGWGLGLLGELAALPAAAVAIAVWAALDLFAHLWLRTHAQGPFERVLRAWSNASRRPSREPAVGTRTGGS